MTANKHPIRILHVVGGMNRGGVETWLMHVLRHIDRTHYQMDFLVHTTEPCAYDEEICSLGSKIIPCASPSSPLRYAHQFGRILRTCGPYDVIHSHVYHYSGYIMLLAHQAGTRTRIAHSHTAAPQTGAGMLRQLYVGLMKRWIHSHATAGLAVSRKAAESLFGPAWTRDPRCRLLYYGIDLTPFRDPVNRTAIRAEHGIPFDAFVAGHVGRFMAVKNHTFLIDIASELIKRRPEMYVLLVGDGPLRQSIERRVVLAGLTDRVIFTGARSDVARLMLGAMDVLVLPSLHEGLPLVALEAQAAGLPLVVAEQVTTEVDLVDGLIHRLSLQQPACEWAEAILVMEHQRPPVFKQATLVVMEKSPFNIQESVQALTTVYTRGTS